MANKVALFNNDFIKNSLVNYKKPQFISTGYQFKINKTVEDFVYSTVNSLSAIIERMIFDIHKY